MAVHLVGDKAEVRDMVSSRPWDGDTPYISIYADSSSFVRRDDGIWCKKDNGGRLYLVNANCERCAKPRTVESTAGQNYDQSRPSEVSPHVWLK